LINWLINSAFKMYVKWKVVIIIPVCGIIGQ
jgi:hypothetical protein